MNVIEQINNSLTIGALTTNILLFVLTVTHRNPKGNVYRYFFFFMLLNLWVLLNECGIYWMGGHTGPVIDVLIRMMDFIGYALVSVQNVIFAFYLYAYLSGKGAVSKKTPYLVVGGFSVCTILLAFIAQFTHMYARFDELNYYYQQDTYWISAIFPTATVLFFLIEILRYRRLLRGKELAALLIYLGLPFVCYVLEVSIANLWLSHIGVTVSILLIYLNIQTELQRQYEAELAENRILIVLSQIKPHFLYNALSAISELCRDNKEAQKAIITFSKYLRGNMDSFMQKTPIPFAYELEHVKQYLRLEELRFKSRLRVQYDIQTEMFRLPVLSLQPIVENAVRYGITKRRSGGTVVIKTEETASCFRVIVSDDGVGFDPAIPPKNDRSHVGIQNVRARLGAMCGGSLAIESEVGRGTVATIEIPKEANGHDHTRGRR